MPTLLVVHHTPSPAVHSMFTAVMEGATNDQIAGVDVVARPALVTAPIDVLEAEAVVLGTPANLGYMSGALKHFFDQIYYPCLEASGGLPYGLFVHGNDDTTGAVRGVEKIVTGLRWRQAHAHVTVTGAPTRPDLDGCWDLGATLAATIAP